MSRKYHLLTKFGITEEQYYGLLHKQNYLCGVCRKHHETFKTRLAVDHDHHTGEIRGLLCNYCNHRVVGRYRKETASLLQAAYEYLTGQYTGWIVPPKKKKRKKNGRRRKSRAA